MAVPQYRGSITIRDSESHESVMTIYIDGVADEAAALVALNDFRGTLDPLTDGQVSKMELTRVVYTSPLVPSGNVDNEIKGQFTFHHEDGGVMQLSVPAFNRTLLRPNSSEIDTDAAAVDAFVSDFIGGPYTDHRAADVISLKSALEQYTSRRN